ncbi:MAG TPA: hypothetical protein PKG54_17295 [Phycisphaerae bacterium]|jgi:hypothetical protein|nr:hypothetical protein [Phycisphaerae bacterium]HOB76269.1 hypothetical protein [Phycisphaerae bacterium]HOJ53663.1 hypothetical protein [Phycisphaerae bacterium]HOL26388.1 hypothetical protein [Phycisphaerae bacterium]HPU34655.1 hypothetical protein [Phycisphaerae bacterium]
MQEERVRTCTKPTEGRLRCACCGYDLHGNTSGTCSECGHLVLIHREAPRFYRTIVRASAVLIALSSAIYVSSLRDWSNRGDFFINSRPGWQLPEPSKLVKDFVEGRRSDIVGWVWTERTAIFLHLFIPFVLCYTAWIVWRQYGEPGRVPRYAPFLSLLAACALITALWLGWYHERHRLHRGLEPEKSSIAPILPFLHTAWLIFWAVAFDRPNKMLAQLGLQQSPPC